MFFFRAFVVGVPFCLLFLFFFFLIFVCYLVRLVGSFSLLCLDEVGRCGSLFFPLVVGYFGFHCLSSCLWLSSFSVLVLRGFFFDSCASFALPCSRSVTV